MKKTECLYWNFAFGLISLAVKQKYFCIAAVKITFFDDFEGFFVEAGLTDEK